MEQCENKQLAPACQIGGEPFPEEKHGENAKRKALVLKMAKDKYYGKTLRKNFARHEEVMAMPNLLEIQKKSYQWFLDTGLREVFADVPPSATMPATWS